MWKKDEEQTQQSTPIPTSTAAAGTVTRPQPTPTTTKTPGFATIGPSIVIRGEVTGDEDLLIQGQVDGSVTLGLHAVTIGDGGRVKAGITGRVITVEGAVEGDLSAQEQIILRGTARVRGDLNAPRVVLEDGATFRGLVDMGTAPDMETARKAKEPSTSGATGGATRDSSKASASDTDRREPKETPKAEGPGRAQGKDESSGQAAKSATG